MPSQAQINHFCAHPEQFMKCNAIKWLGKGPEDQAIIDVLGAFLDGAPPLFPTRGDAIPLLALSVVMMLCVCRSSVHSSNRIGKLTTELTAPPSCSTATRTYEIVEYRPARGDGGY